VQIANFRCEIVGFPGFRDADYLKYTMGYFEKQWQWFFGCDSPAIHCKPPVEAGFTLLSGLLPTGWCAEWQDRTSVYATL
jgi:hypothetical protein